MHTLGNKSYVPNLSIVKSDFNVDQSDITKNNLSSNRKKLYYPS